MSSIYTPRITELEDLVRQPVEREWLELKSWLDLAVPLDRANTARHLAAIANYGGGYIVFGFNSDGSRCIRKDDANATYSHDTFAGVIERYLHPKFQCEVAFPEVEGVIHPIVWIPSHGASPVLSKADGPQDEKNRIQGIRSGLIYVRTPKPESLPSSSPDHLDKVIQRCVLARRDELVTMFTAIVAGGAPKAGAEPADDSTERLGKWHQATQRAAIQEAGRTGFKLSNPLAENFLQFSYLIRHSKDERVPDGKAFEVIEKLNTAVRDTVRYGWSMFHPFTRPEIAPRIVTDPAIGDGNRDFIQTSLFEGDQTDHGEFWRIALDGRASLLRNLHEDRFPTPHEVPTGKRWFDPWLHVRDITELVRHARAFAEEFTDVTEICFQLEWKGLKSRVVAATPNSRRYYSDTYTSHSDARTIVECIPQAEIIGDLPGVVARLFAPVYRMFDARADISAEYVSRRLPGFIARGM